MPLRRIVPLRDALSRTFFKRAASPDVRLSRLSLRLSCLSYRHPERSRGIFVAAAFLIPALIRLHETPYPPMHGKNRLPVFTRIHRLTANEKDFSLSLEMTHGEDSRPSSWLSSAMANCASSRHSILRLWRGPSPRAYSLTIISHRLSCRR